MVKDSFKDLQFLKLKYEVSYLLAILANRGFHSLLIYRVSNLLHRYKVPLLPLIFTRIIHIMYGIDIDYKAKIKGGVIIIHGVGTVIGAGAVIEEGCIIYHQVTLGIKGNGKFDGFPKVEANCILAAGSKLLGAISIGQNSVIGVNAVVTRDVPKESLVKVADSIVISERNKEV